MQGVCREIKKKLLIHTKHYRVYVLVCAKEKNRETINFSEKMKISSKIEMFILFYSKISLKSIEIKIKIIYHKKINI